MSKTIKAFKLLLLSVIFCVFCFDSCKDKKDTLTLNYMLDYYPLDTGHYVIYDIDSILFHYNGLTHNNDTAHFQVKELVADTFYDNLNQLTYRLELYRRKNSSADWDIWKVWFARRSSIYPVNLVKTEDDIKFVKLVFPPQQGEPWEGNQFVPTTDPYKIFQNWDYHYTAVNEPYTINFLNFDSTLTVSEADNENLIEKTLRKEVYAKGVGMIYQEWESMTKTTVSADWNTGPETGFRIRMRVNSHYP